MADTEAEKTASDQVRLVKRALEIGFSDLKTMELIASIQKSPSKVSTALAKLDAGLVDLQKIHEEPQS